MATAERDPRSVEKEQQVVNQLRKHMTPRITKKIGKAFNKVRYANCSYVKKVQYKMELVEQVKELEHRRDGAGHVFFSKS